MNFNKCQHGITLVELMVTMAILGLVGGLGVTIYLQANQAFTRAEERWIMQTDMRRTATFINRTLRNSYNAEIEPENIKAVEDMEEDDRYLYLRDEDGNNFGEIWYKDKETNQLLIGEDGGKYEYSIDFELTENEGLTLNKTMSYVIKARSLDSNVEEADYSVDSALHLVNMAKQGQIKNTEGTIQGVYFKSKFTDTGSPTPEFSTFCFIATASYGSANRQPVRILRMFRDLYLRNFETGQKLINLYYNYSPPLARFVSGRALLSFLLRIILLPLVGVAYLIIVHQILLPWATAGLIIYLFYRIYRYDFIKVR